LAAHYRERFHPVRQSSSKSLIKHFQIQNKVKVFREKKLEIMFDNFATLIISSDIRELKLVKQKFSAFLLTKWKTRSFFHPDLLL
jgi:hypothetical protein